MKPNTLYAVTDSRTIGGPTFRRGLSIGAEIGPVADWPLIRADIEARQEAERAQAQEERRRRVAEVDALAAGNAWLAKVLDAGDYVNSGLTVDQLARLKSIIGAADALADAVAVGSADTGVALLAYGLARRGPQS